MSMVGACVLLSGCACNGGTPKGPAVRDAATFKADAQPGEKAKLVLAGTEILVEVKRRVDGAETVIELSAHGQIVQQERYASSDQQFSLVMAGGERYEPPLPLVKFPMEVGDTWKWEGKLGTPGNLRPAKCTVTTASEQVYAPAPESAVKVQVELELESGGPLPARRTLAFWMVEGRGVVKRQFGSGSSREPG